MAPISIFHPPKIKRPGAGTGVTGRPSPSKPSGAGPSNLAAAARKLEPSTEDFDSASQLPDTPFQEFKLMSAASNGWKYNTLKFDSRKPVDPMAWESPIKLNRKDPRRGDAAPTEQEAVGPMLGLDGKPVVGADGQHVMVDVNGRPIHPKDPEAKPKARGKFKPKAIRQVFLVPDATRQLRREERHPWVLEDASKKEVWIGKLEEVAKAETHAFFVPAMDGIFKFLPAHRWYKFQKKPSYHVPTLEEAEAIMAKMAKNKDPERWLLRNGKAPSEATAAIFKAEAEGRGVSGGTGSLVHTSGSSQGPGGRKLKTVDNGMDSLFGDDEDDPDAKRRRAKEFGGEGDMDEMLYDEEFADDDEKIEEDGGDDEEAKELEERMKKQYKSANKQREGNVDESDDEEEGGMTAENKAMRKMIQNREKNDMYDSDDEDNPYASDVEEEKPDEAVPAKVEPAVQQQPQQVAPRPGSQTSSKRPAATPASKAGSRATSPSAGGHSVVAMRATSPKPKLKTNVNATSRGNSPLSPGPSGPGSRATSPSQERPSNKRKASDEAGGAPSPGGAPSKPKKRKPTTGSAPVGALTEGLIIAWLQNTPSPTTKLCITEFKPYIEDETSKKTFTSIIKSVAVVKDGILVLKSAYTSRGATPT